MPGLVGIIGRRPLAEAAVMFEKMLEGMMHEAFYTRGNVTSANDNLVAGCVAHKDSFSDRMPIWNPRRDICLLFSGEDHSQQASDVAYLLRRYEQRDGNFFASLNGIFSGLVLDLRANKIILFNDRYGLNRVYYHENKDGFHFASEAKSLLKILPELRHLDSLSLAEFFSCGCSLQDRSLFSGIHLLPPASSWTFQAGQPVRKETYFDRKDWETRSQTSTEDYYIRLKETFAHILPRYLHNGQAAALSLTGGLDSRMILACAKPPPSTLPCYTFGGMYRECADVRLAKKLAQASHQPHQVISITSDFFHAFPELARKSVYYTDGAMDVTGSVELFANRIARQIAPVRLTGNYGSEILRGNVAFKPVSLSGNIFTSDFGTLLKTARETYANEKAGNPTSFIAFKQVPWHHFGRFAAEQSQLTVRSPFLDNDLVRLAYQAPAELSLNKELTHRLIAECYPELARIPTDRGRITRVTHSTSRFKHFRQEFMPRAEYVYDYGMPQWLAKADRWMRPLHVERLFLGRQKFTHFRTWYRNELSGYIKDVLLDPRALARTYLNRHEAENAVTAHVTGRGNYTMEIHRLLTAELIQRELIEQT